MNRYQAACEQATAFLELVGEIGTSGPDLPDLPVIAELTEHLHREMIDMGDVPSSATTEERSRHQEAWQDLVKKLNKQVRSLDEALGHYFLRAAGRVIERHQKAVDRSEAELAREL